MKKILLLATALFMAAPNMQAKGDKKEVKIVLVKEENSDNYYYEGVVPVDGVNKEEMFKRAKDWVLSTFKTEDNNIQYEESTSIINSTTILIKGKKYKLALFANALVNFKFNLQFKEGKYKFRIDNIMVKSTGVENYPVSPYGMKMIPNWKKYNEYLVEEINKSFYQMSIDLNNSIRGTGTKKDDW